MRSKKTPQKCIKSFNAYEVIFFFHRSYILTVIDIMDDRIKKAHSLHLENRSGLKITGVTDVGSFDEESVTAYTDYGCLSVSGTGLNVQELNLNSGVLEVSGEVTAIVYSSKTSAEKNIFKRIFSA